MLAAPLSVSAVLIKLLSGKEGKEGEGLNYSVAKSIIVFSAKPITGIITKNHRK